MPFLLFVTASPRGVQSRSITTARRMATALKETGWTLDELDLWREPLPPLDGATIAAKYARLARTPHDGAQAAAWDGVAAMVARLDRADRVLIATPMWNFGIPYRLKHWIDLVTQPGLSFSFDPATGYAALLRDRPTTVVLASAGDYARGPSWGRPDLASDYLRAALGFVGLRSLEIVRLGPTIGEPATVEAARMAAEARLDAITDHAHPPKGE